MDRLSIKFWVEFGEN